MNSLDGGGGPLRRDCCGFCRLCNRLLHQAGTQYFARSGYALAATRAQAELTREIAQAAGAFANGLFDLAVGDRFAYADVHAVTLN